MRSSTGQNHHFFCRAVRKSWQGTKRWTWVGQELFVHAHGSRGIAFRAFHSTTYPGWMKNCLNGQSPVYTPACATKYLIFLFIASCSALDKQELRYGSEVAWSMRWRVNRNIVLVGLSSSFEKILIKPYLVLHLSHSYCITLSSNISGTTRPSCKKLIHKSMTYMLKPRYKWYYGLSRDHYWPSVLTLSGHVPTTLLSNTTTERVQLSLYIPPSHT